MESVGEYLRRIRLERGFSIESVAEKTRISPFFIQALEENRMEKFPGEVFARGFVRVYGRCLGLDDQDTMSRFSQSAQDFFRKREEEERSTERSAELAQSRRKSHSRLANMIVAIVLGLAILTVYVINADRSSRSVEAPETILPGPDADFPSVPEASEAFPPVLTEPALNKPALREEESKPRPVPVPVKPPVDATPAPVKPATAPLSPAAPIAAKPADPPAAPPAAAPALDPAVKPGEKLPPAVNVPGKKPESSAGAGSGELILVVEAVEPSWISAKIDGRDTKEVFLQAGEKVTWKAADHFVVNFGNAGGVKVHVNGKPLPPFGPKGTVVKNVKIARE